MESKNEWTVERFMNEVVKPHYDELASQFNSRGLDEAWFKKKYREKSSLRDAPHGNAHAGWKEIHAFWKNLRGAVQGDLQFGFEVEKMKIFDVQLKSPRFPGSNEVIHIGVFWGSYEIGKATADPPFEGVWIHWDDCNWSPETEYPGR